MTLLAADDPRSTIAAIVVTFNSADMLPGLLASLHASTAAVRAIVVDNDSHDDTLAVARSWPHVSVIPVGANLGYSGAINVGRRRVRPGEHVAILNPDLSVAPDALERMSRALERSTVGIVAPQLRDAATGARFDSLRREPTVLRALGDSLFGERLRARPGWFAETLRRDREYARARDVAWAGGAALLVSARCDSAVGPWDAKTYFLYSEETDYARRARDRGFAVRYEPSAVAHHVGAGSGQPAPLVALNSVNRIRYFERRHSRTHTAAFQLAVAVQHVLRLHDPRHRYALPYVLRRSTWAGLPSGAAEASGTRETS
jgi:GT2 family glycosyltransferase